MDFDDQIVVLSHQVTIACEGALAAESCNSFSHIVANLSELAPSLQAPNVG